MTILLTPFMSCSAKIPIYAFFSAAFFPKYAALVMIGLYVLGILFGILSALVLKSAFRGRPVPFVMELPNYRLPSLKSVALLLWDKAKDFIERAFTVIFLATIVIWFLQSFDARLNVVTSSEQSLLAIIGRWLAPIFAPLGFADWRCATALISGFIAKESVVSTLQILLGASAVSTLFTTKTALSFLVFTLLYTPCVAAIAAIRREVGLRPARRADRPYAVLRRLAGRVRAVPAGADPIGITPPSFRIGIDGGCCYETIFPAIRTAGAGAGGSAGALRGAAGAVSTEPRHRNGFLGAELPHGGQGAGRQRLCRGAAAVRRGLSGERGRTEDLPDL